MSLTPAVPTCSHPACTKRVRARGLCVTHYGAARIKGELPQEWPRPITQVRPENWHVMTDVDAERLTGTCSLCGSVSVVAKRETSGTFTYRCHVKTREDRAKRRERHKLEGRPKNLSTYGLTWPEYQTMMQRQGKACAICRVKFTRRPCVDHDHHTGVVRGLLCQRCNVALGWLDDSPRKVLAAHKYLTQSAGRIF